MESKEQTTLSAEQKQSLELEELTRKSEKELLARMLIGQGITNDILERNRKNTSTLTTMAWVILILSIFLALLPADTTLIEILD